MNYMTYWLHDPLASSDVSLPELLQQNGKYRNTEVNYLILPSDKTRSTNHREESSSGKNRIQNKLKPANLHETPE